MSVQEIQSEHLPRIVVEVIPDEVQLAGLDQPIERGLAGPGMLTDTIVKRWQVLSRSLDDGVTRSLNEGDGRAARPA